MTVERLVRVKRGDTLIVAWETVGRGNVLEEILHPDAPVGRAGRFVQVVKTHPGPGAPRDHNEER